MSYDNSRRLLAFLEWIQLGVLLPTLYPAAYLVIVDRDDRMILPLFLAGLLILLPALIAKAAIRFVHGFLPYAAVCALAFVLTWFASEMLTRISPWTREAVTGFRIALLIETFAVMLTCLNIRIRENSRARALKENDMDWTEREFLLEKAQFPLLIWFAVLYLIALNFDCRTGCDVAIAAFFIYGAIACLDRHLRETEKYISVLSYVKQFPLKRVRTIGTGIVLTFLLVSGVAAGLPAFVTAGFRTYRDLRKWAAEREMSGEIDWENDPLEMMNPEDPYKELMMRNEYEFVPEWVDQLVRALGYIFLGGFALILVRLFWKFCGEFRDRSEDNGDIATTLPEDRIEKIARRPSRRGESGSERERIRRRYRREIRSRRKDRPGAAETPAEIEAGAGLCGTREGEELHEAYEKARYDME